MVTELAAGLWHLPGRGANVYVAEDGDDLVLVDAGTPWDAGGISEALATVGYGVADVDRVLVTHYDLDHVGALASLTPGLEATVHIHPHEAALLTGERQPPLGRHKGAFQRLVRPLLAVPDLPLAPLEDGETVGSFTAYHTPGHSPGHLAFVSEALDAAFLGDLVHERGGRLVPSPWLTAYDSDAVDASIAALAERAPQFEHACMGHGNPITRGSDALARCRRN
jgi:glyoxylase-like metal-dependent hydrolase (beta-lactamase superfamily II)